MKLIAVCNYFLSWDYGAYSTVPSPDVHTHHTNFPSGTAKLRAN